MRNVQSFRYISIAALLLAFESGCLTGDEGLDMDQGGLAAGPGKDAGAVIPGPLPPASVKVDAALPAPDLKKGDEGLPACPDVGDKCEEPNRGFLICCGKEQVEHYFSCQVQPEPNHSPLWKDVQTRPNISCTTTVKPVEPISLPACPQLGAACNPGGAAARSDCCSSQGTMVFYCPGPGDGQYNAAKGPVWVVANASKRACSIEKPACN